jgi:hypothetical protein
MDCKPASLRRPLVTLLTLMTLSCSLSQTACSVFRRKTVVKTVEVPVPVLVYRDRPVVVPAECPVEHPPTRRVVVWAPCLPNEGCVGKLDRVNMENAIINEVEQDTWIDVVVKRCLPKKEN